MDERITPKLWAQMKEIQASMAIEGWDMSEEELEQLACRCAESKFPELMEKLKIKAEAEGRDFDEVMDEHFGWTWDEEEK